jgi:hypothetical protein
MLARAMSESEGRRAMEGSTGPALFRAFPRLAGRVPWVSLGEFPTRVEQLQRLVSPSVEVWVKHDDESAPR